jgi:nucleoside 2-deoxyribosyltransferase
MKASLIYLAGPIHGLSDQDCRYWRQKASQLLRAKSMMTISPMSNDCRGREGRFVQQLVNREKVWIQQCDTVLANCWTPSYGTSMEILYAWEQHKQVVVISQSKNPWLICHSDLMVDTIEDAIDQLEYRGA